MCGRYVIISTPEAIRAMFGYAEQPNFPPRYNVAPTQPIPVVRLHDGKRSLTLMRWGLLPSWVKDPKTFPLLINARGERQDHEMPLDAAGSIVNDRLAKADQLDRLDRQRGLLADFADYRLLQRFAQLNAAARQRIETMRRRPCPPRDQHPPVVEDRGADGEVRPRRIYPCVVGIAH